jgi:hypothetical protein
MENTIVEEFKEPVILDSVRTIFIQIELDEHLFTNLIFRILKNNQEVEYCFNYVLEYSQRKAGTPHGLYIKANSDWYKEYKKNNKNQRQATLEREGSRNLHQLNAKHFIFTIDGYSFHILAESYTIEDGFFEVYRSKSEKIRKIVS